MAAALGGRRASGRRGRGSRGPRLNFSAVWRAFGSAVFELTFGAALSTSGADQVFRLAAARGSDGGYEGRPREARHGWSEPRALAPGSLAGLPAALSGVTARGFRSSLVGSLGSESCVGRGPAASAAEPARESNLRAVEALSRPSRSIWRKPERRANKGNGCPMAGLPLSGARLLLTSTRRAIALGDLASFTPSAAGRSRGSKFYLS